MPEEPATRPVAHTEPVCCKVIKGRATSVSRRPVQLTKVASRMRSTSLLTPPGWRRRAGRGSEEFLGGLIDWTYGVISRGGGPAPGRRHCAARLAGCGGERAAGQPAVGQSAAGCPRETVRRAAVRPGQHGRAPTAAGQEMVAEAGHILGHLERVFERSRAAAESETITVGTIPSLAMLVFPALHVALPHLRTSQVVDHGPRLVGWVAESSLDAAFVAIAGQIELPKGVTSQVVGVDRIESWRLQPATCSPPTVGSSSAGRSSPTQLTTRGRSSTGASSPWEQRRTGPQRPRPRCGWVGCLGHPVVMPRSLLRAYLADSDRELVTHRFGGPRLSLVTRVPIAPYWKSALPIVGSELGLSGVSART